MTTGTPYAIHKHAGVEELFLLQGNLSVDERVITVEEKPGSFNLVPFCLTNKISLWEVFRGGRAERGHPIFR